LTSGPASATTIKSISACGGVRFHEATTAALFTVSRGDRFATPLRDGCRDRRIDEQMTNFPSCLFKIANRKELECASFKTTSIVQTAATR
jgi:hypothetical protein